MRAAIGAVAVGALVWACGTVSPPVPVSGTEADLAGMAGEWMGEYSSAETGRSGSIVFHLIAGTDSAHGDVLMSPMGQGPPPRLSDPGAPAGPPPGGPGGPGGPGAGPQVIAISFVRIEGGRVSGRLAPYIDPACDCPVQTVFEGRLVDGVIEGTYFSRRPEAATEQRGRWRVERRGP